MFFKKLKKKEIKVGLHNQEIRDKWVETVLKSIPVNSRILDAGAGELRYKPYCSQLNYVSQDFGKYDGIGDNSALQTGNWDQSKLDIISDITCIPEDDNSFDAILCAEVFEHLPEPILTIKEFSRLLKPTGKLILTAPFCCLTHFAPYFYYTGFSKYFYQKHLEDNGFKVIEISNNGNFFEYMGQELRRIEFAAQQYCQSDLSIKEKKAIKILLRTLEIFSEKDSNSKDLLSFGLHILAEKQ